MLVVKREKKKGGGGGLSERATVSGCGLMTWGLRKDMDMDYGDV